jgi:hypothetical protein
MWYYDANYFRLLKENCKFKIKLSTVSAFVIIVSQLKNSLAEPLNVRSVKTL